MNHPTPQVTLPSASTQCPEGCDPSHWQKVLETACVAQALVPKAIVGRSLAATFYAGHWIPDRIEFTVHNLRTDAEALRNILAADSRWTPDPKGNILTVSGFINGISVQFHRQIRTDTPKTSILTTPSGQLVIPSFLNLFDDLAATTASFYFTIGYLHIAALAVKANNDRLLLRQLDLLDDEHDGYQKISMRLCVSQTLCSPPRFKDEDAQKLLAYTKLPSWLNDWSQIARISQRLGRPFTAIIVKKGVGIL